ncbi:MAG TPA: diacylglycerol kinase family protein [Pyrinomonadaceae bacterium]|nr:diacylglycerol kinase family protein [Pyrinomonadaceae bacterium]
MSLPLVIVNPTSARGATREAWPGMASDLRRHFGPFAVAFTEAAGDAARIAEREARAGRPLVIACGGDGTVSEVANGLLLSGADAELGVLPSGTGGDFRRTLGVPPRAADAARALREGAARALDVGRVTFTGDGGAGESRYFLNVASFGMGGDVIRRVKRQAWLGAAGPRLVGGRLAFAAAAAQSALAFERPAVRVRLDGGEESRMTVTNFAVANARFFGGGMKIAPEARLDDGLFDVVAVGDMDALTIFKNSYRLYLGTYLGLGGVRHALARRVSARPAGAGEVTLEVDGEVVGRLPAEFEILPKALRVRCRRAGAGAKP